jgi:co-chaperonin GroES (HSP10)
MRVEPAGYRVIVKPDPLEAVSKGGIVLSYGDDKKRVEQAQITGVVVETGAQAWIAYALEIIKNADELRKVGFAEDQIKAACRPWAAVGDRVYFAKYGGFLIEQNGEQYRLLNDEDITAIIREDAA